VSRVGPILDSASCYAAIFGPIPKMRRASQTGFAIPAGVLAGAAPPAVRTISDPMLKKKAGATRAPAVQLVVCPDKKSNLETAYALRRGRTVKSRTCARMLDICIPFSCDRYGMTSETNESSINSRTSS